MATLEKIRLFLAGKKTYLLAVIAILTALAGWVEGSLSLWQFLAAAWAALQTAFLRAGVAKA